MALNLKMDMLTCSSCVVAGKKKRKINNAASWHFLYLMPFHFVPFQMFPFWHFLHLAVSLTKSIGSPFAISYCSVSPKSGWQWCDDNPGVRCMGKNFRLINMTAEQGCTPVYLQTTQNRNSLDNQHKWLEFLVFLVSLGWVFLHII